MLPSWQTAAGVHSSTHLSLKEALPELHVHSETQAKVFQKRVPHRLVLTRVDVSTSGNQACCTGDNCLCPCCPLGSEH